jgi:CubicO group peptidase (beta-lactamase class C family)
LRLTCFTARQSGRIASQARQGASTSRNPHKAGSPTGTGTDLWDGAAGTWFWIDPVNDIVFVGMIQRLAAAAMPNLQDLSRALVRQALVGR